MIANLPDFIPVPSAEIMHITSIALIIIGVCLICVGIIIKFSAYKKENKNKISWGCIIVGAILIANHLIQLLF